MYMLIENKYVEKSDFLTNAHLLLKVLGKISDFLKFLACNQYLQLKILSTDGISDCLNLLASITKLTAKNTLY